MDLEEQTPDVRALLRGDPPRMGADQPMLREHAGLAGWILRRAGSQAAFPCPHDLARGLGLTLAPSTNCPVAVLVHPPRILYRSSRLPRHEGLRVLLGVVGAELSKTASFVPADAWLVSGHIALPNWARNLQPEELEQRQRWVPRWFLRSLCSRPRAFSSRPIAP